MSSLSDLTPVKVYYQKDSLSVFLVFRTAAQAIAASKAVNCALLLRDKRVPADENGAYVRGFSAKPSYGTNGAKPIESAQELIQYLGNLLRINISFESCIPIDAFKLTVPQQPSSSKTNSHPWRVR